jgi:peroxiredoxin
MISLLATVALAAAMPVVPVRQAHRLVQRAAGKDQRPVVLHFWATWCEACRDEFPALRPQLKGFPKQGVGVLLVSIDRPEDKQKAQQMLADFKLAAVKAVLLDAPDPRPVAKAVGEPSWDGTLPATFVFDAQQKLRKSFIGRADPRAVRAAVRAITH